MYDPTFAHKITMTLYEDRLRLTATGAGARHGAATGALRGLLDRMISRIARWSPIALAPETAATSCTR